MPKPLVGDRVCLARALLDLYRGSPDQYFLAQRRGRLAAVAGPSGFVVWDDGETGRYHMANLCRPRSLAAVEAPRGSTSIRGLE